MALNRRHYLGVQVTLAANNVIYNLKALVDAVLQAEGGAAVSVESPGACRELKLGAPTGNTGTIFVGDGLLVPTGAGRQAGEIPKGTTRLYGLGDCNNVDFGQIYATPATAGDKLNVEIMVS